MNSEELKQKLIKTINASQKSGFDCEEEYYFALAQVLVYIFVKLGGIDKYMREFNYLTNPYIPANIQDISKRTLRFIKNISKMVDIEDESFVKAYKLLFSMQSGFVAKNINEKECENAFYSGLHTENVFLNM